MAARPVISSQFPPCWSLLEGLKREVMDQEPDDVIMMFVMFWSHHWFGGFQNMLRKTNYVHLRCLLRMSNAPPQLLLVGNLSKSLSNRSTENLRFYGLQWCSRMFVWNVWEECFSWNKHTALKNAADGLLLREGIRGGRSILEGRAIPQAREETVCAGHEMTDLC